jgi:hypothetical protein
VLRSSRRCAAAEHAAEKKRLRKVDVIIADVIGEIALVFAVASLLPCLNVLSRVAVVIFMFVAAMLVPMRPAVP